MKNSIKTGFLLLIAFSTTAFIQQSNSAVIKGKLKRIDRFLSGTHEDYLYDSYGRLSTVYLPYGKKYTYTYSGSYVFVENIDPTRAVHYDTLIMKTYGLVDSALSEESIRNFSYDFSGNLTSQNYVPLVGRKRKAGKNQYHYYLDYYSQQWDSVSADVFACSCGGKVGRNLLKTLVGINAGGDTIEYFTYKYSFDKEEKVKTRTKYYRNGQLYDSLGFSYY